MKLCWVLSLVAVTSKLCSADESDVFLSSGNDDNICAEGLRYIPGYGCEDIDECRELIPCQVGQTCRNIYGNYTCLCPRGFRMNNNGECTDRDECAMGYCGTGQMCINTLGSFQCHCLPGTMRIGRFCRDINECMHKPCNDNQHCINTKGSYRCECKAGYRENGNRTCDDIDECTSGMCSAMGEKCYNTAGSYECICHDGFEKDKTTEGRYCKDVDECQDESICPQYSECYNVQGSYSCRCHRGFSFIGGKCLDKTECTSGEGQKCQWQCEDLPGTYRCLCPQGFDKIGFNCIDVNECDRKMAVCKENETCVNTQGGYKCVRPPRCPMLPDGNSIYRKVMKTDEFGYRQVTTNICRRQRCGKVSEDIVTVNECKSEPLSVSYHYVAVPSGLPQNTAILHISYSMRRRRQRYNFIIVQGNEDGMFLLKQVSIYQPRAKLVVSGNLEGPSSHIVKIDMSTYHPTGRMRDSRMLTVTIYTSMYDF